MPLILKYNISSSDECKRIQKMYSYQFETHSFGIKCVLLIFVIVIYSYKELYFFQRNCVKMSFHTNNEHTWLLLLFIASSHKYVILLFKLLVGTPHYLTAHFCKQIWLNVKKTHITYVLHIDKTIIVVRARRNYTIFSARVKWHCVHTKHFNMLLSFR